MAEREYDADESLAEATEESNPSAAGPEGLQGGMGISSERTGPYGGADPTRSGIQGTGTHGSATDRTDGTKSTLRDAADAQQMEDAHRATRWGEPQPPGESSPGADIGGGIDRTVGESNTANVPPHRSDRRKNPGHSHG